MLNKDKPLKTVLPCFIKSGDHSKIYPDLYLIKKVFTRYLITNGDLSW